MLNSIQQKLKTEEFLRKKKEFLRKKKKDIIEHNNKIKIYNNLNVNFNIKSEYNSIIPLNLYTCWHTQDLPPLMKVNYDLLVKQNPEFNHHFFDENDCIEFIKTNFETDVLDAYNTLVPCAYKADLFRYCILYINGGIYMDVKFKCVNNFKLIALTEKEYFVRDRPKHMIANGLIVSNPKNHILFKCINKIVQNTKTKFYGSTALSPTGPGLLGSFFSLNEIEKFEFHHSDTKTVLFQEKTYIVYKNTIILIPYERYRDEQKKFQKNKYYNDLYKERKIYKK